MNSIGDAVVAGRASAAEKAVCGGSRGDDAAVAARQAGTLEACFWWSGRRITEWAAAAQEAVDGMRATGGALSATGARGCLVKAQTAMDELCATFSVERLSVSEIPVEQACDELLWMRDIALQLSQRSPTGWVR
jgi:hypothetical protein